MKNEPVEKTLHIDPQHLHAYSTGLLQGKAYSRLYTYLARTLLPFNISIPEWKLLGQLHEHQDIKLSELAVLLSYDPPMITKLVKRLEKKKLVKRTHDKKDERAKIIKITREGHTLIKNAEMRVKKTMRQILGGVSREELMTYLKVLTVIVNNTEE
jgi:MarR family transcriptional regulator, organic hydroperoxide resistance regulator